MEPMSVGKGRHNLGLGAHLCLRMLVYYTMFQNLDVVMLG